MEATIKLPKLHPAQKKIIATQKRFNTVCCGRRFGKSILALDRLIDSPRGCLEGFPVSYCAPSYKLLDESFRQLKTILSSVATRVDGSSKRIELVTGGSIDCWTLQDSEAGRSRKYSVLVIDEAAHVDDFEDIWTKALRATLADYSGEAWFLSTPNGFNYYKSLYDKGDPSTKYYESEWSSWQMPTSENPYIDKVEIEAAKKDLPELAFRQEFLAEFISVEGALLRPSYIKVGEPPDNTGKTVVGVDLAITTKDSSDYTALVVITLHPTGNIYVREVTRFKGQFNDILTEIKRTAQKWNPSVIGIEKVQFQAAVIQELLRTTQLNVIGIKPEGDKTTRFLPVVARYEQGLIYHSPTLIPDFEKELLVFPINQHSPDMVDAFSIAFKSLNYSAAPLITLSVKGL